MGMRMTQMLLLGLSVILCCLVPFVSSGFGLLTDEMCKEPFDFDLIMGVGFKGDPVKLPGSVPTEGVFNITAENMDIHDPSQAEKMAEAERREMLDSLLNRPRALLYTEANFTGFEEKYQYGDRPTEMDYRGSCININTEHLGLTGVFSGHLQPGWKSVKTFGSCVRLFQEFDCQSKSIAVYPGVSGEHVYLEDECKIYYPLSVGPCLEHEFKFASISKVNGELAVKKDKSNFLQIPDQLFASRTLSAHVQFSPYAPTTVQHLVIDIGLKYNRTRDIYVDLALSECYYLESYPGEEIIPDKEVKWRPFLQDKKEGDDLGYLIPPKLGGPTDESYNIFPQSREHYRDWTAVTEIIFDSFKAKGGHYPKSIMEFLYITLYYENQESTRPFGLYYHVSLLMAYEGHRIDYGFLYN